ncbi:hypothetical protein Tco_0900354, partial [Tanacetum coccineum]
VYPLVVDKHQVVVGKQHMVIGKQHVVHMMVVECKVFAINASGYGNLALIARTSFASCSLCLRDIDHATGEDLMELSAEEAWDTTEDCAQCDKQWKNPISTITDESIANLKAQLVGNEMVRVK